MRRTTQQILLLLYQFLGENERRITIATLRELLPGLSDGGFRSLIHVMQARELLHVHKASSGNVVIGTATGDRAIEAVFPWLRESSAARRSELPESVGDSQGLLLIFRTPSKHDPQFRRLRKLVLAEGAVLVSRGCYVMPARIPMGLWVELTERYQSNVMVLSVASWLMGNQRALYNSTQQHSDVITALSGVSREMDRLITHELAWRELTHQQKTSFLSLLQQAIDIFGEMSGQFDEKSEVLSLSFSFVRKCQQLVVLS